MSIKKQKHKTRRTIKNKSVGVSKTLTIVGTNANGIVSKIDSLALVVKELSPAVIILQETKVNRKGQVSLPGYEIFKLIRESDTGGSLLTAIHCDLSPVLISETDDGIEILVVQAQVESFKCTFINAYGPQEYASNEDKIAFYARLDQEVKNAKLADSLVCLELDANAKLGSSIIANDPHEMLKNGEFLIDFVMRNNLIICNATEKCQGTITRQRTTVSGTEKSVLDYLIVCQDMYTLLDSVKIDEERALTLSRYVNKSGNTIVTKSDHNIIQGKFDLKWCRQNHMKNHRTEIFDFKNTEGIQKFK